MKNKKPADNRNRAGKESAAGFAHGKKAGGPAATSQKSSGKAANTDTGARSTARTKKPTLDAKTPPSPQVPAAVKRAGSYKAAKKERGEVFPSQATVPEAKANPPRPPFIKGGDKKEFVKGREKTGFPKGEKREFSKGEQKEPLTGEKKAFLKGEKREFLKGGERKEFGKGGERGGAARPVGDRAKLHCGQTLELAIVSTNEDGFGIAMHEGTRVLVAGGLPGEVLVARVTYVGRRETFANVIKCLKGSPDRETAPACALGRACDGCPLIQMRYPAQLAWKKELVTKELRKYPSLTGIAIHDTIASPNRLNYRNTAKLVVAGKFSDPVIGIYRRNTHDVLEIEDCPLHHPLINKVVKATRAGIKKGKVPVYNAKSEMGLLRYLVVRVAEASNQVMVVFVTSDQGYNEIHHLAKFVQQAVPEVAVVAQNINTSTGNVIFGHKDRSITRERTLRAFIGDKAFNLSPNSFFQVNSGAARIIYEKVREYARLTGTERVLDVYCGIGGISLFLADKAREVVGIEYVEAAVADATENAKLNHADNCSFEAGDAVHLIDEIGEEGGAEVIVLNPPRKGCDEKVLRSVAEIKPARIIYVSCSPETLARDLDILARLGYRTLEVQPVDMFPQTVHVEDVAVLEKVQG